MLTFIKDQDLIYDTEKYDVILVGTSIYCDLKNGFQSKMRYKYPFLQEGNDKTPYADLRKLGTRLTFYDNKPIISLLYIAKYCTKKKPGIQYDALEKCLLAANAEFAGKRVATTIVGHSVYEGGGGRDKCLEIIEKCTDKLDLTIYDYFQRKKDGEKYEYFKYVRSFAHKDKEKYKELLAGEREEFKKRYLL